MSGREQPLGFGGWLYEAMLRAGYETAVDLARAADLDPATVGRWPRDDMRPQVQHLRRLAGPLREPLLVLLVRAGHLEPDEVDLRGYQPPPEPEYQHPALRAAVRRVMDAIESDPDLTPADREEMLQLALGRLDDVVQMVQMFGRARRAAGD